MQISLCYTNPRAVRCLVAALLRSTVLHGASSWEPLLVQRVVLLTSARHKGWIYNINSAGMEKDRHILIVAFTCVLFPSALLVLQFLAAIKVSVLLTKA